MSIRDRGLLEAAGLSISDATELFQRSRQALYQGLSHQRDYFSAKDAMILVHHAKRSDSPRIEELIRFIDANYPQSETALILLDRIGHEQLGRAVDAADQIILVFNGNLDHLTATSTFAKVLRSLLSSHRMELHIAVPGDWVIGYIAEHFEGATNRIKVINEVSHLPSFLVITKQGTYRAFVFARFAVEEMQPTDAERLWQHFAPKFEESFDDRAREAG